MGGHSSIRGCETGSSRTDRYGGRKVATRAGNGVSQVVRGCECRCGWRTRKRVAPLTVTTRGTTDPTRRGLSGTEQGSDGRPKVRLPRWSHPVRLYHK